MPAQLMAVLNVTSDSFSDGYLHKDALAHADRLLAEGADIIDVGGESTRPGALPVAEAEEQRRILPIIAALAHAGARVSVDTRYAGTMAAALDAGAQIVNDVSALHHDPRALETLAGRDCPVILMHMRGTPQTMREHAVYADVVEEVTAELAASVARAEAAGIVRERIIVDPGLGFAKTAAQSLELLRQVGRLKRLGLPVLVGASRKGFLGEFGGETEPAKRAPASVAAALFAASQGVEILRVHDVAATRQALQMWQALHGCVI